MSKVLVLLCCLFCFQESPVVSWQEDYRLVWSDFKGAPQDQGDVAAVTASGITFGVSIKEKGNRVIGFNTNVKAYFYPEQSWYKPEKATEHVLAHEQLHFDITELYARKFRKNIGELKVSNSIKKQLQDLHRTILKELEAAQEKYDSETNFSRHVENQLKWQNKVSAELEKLSSYKLNDSNK
ncbi:DUF922 domain-containing protein [Aestuariivivens insulae]|uniref:DUF922 domain-containing protein n=1 Tax=Aestuariivivens insulae TaxID=1621988 RepID=UPI001F586769|nr:DUF922 domain-containing protein [Aestuariivivens insulae]